MTMPINIHPKYITNDSGEKLSVVLSIEEFEEFEEILEDYEDLAKVAERKDGKLTSHEDFLEELKQDGII